MSYEVMVPRRIDLSATTHNGGISVEDVEGDMDFEAENGGISIREAAGNINAHTTNGGLSAHLTGTSWKGERLDLRTTNGGVSLDIAVPSGTSWTGVRGCEEFFLRIAPTSENHEVARLTGAPYAGCDTFQSSASGVPAPRTLPKSNG